MTDEVRNRSAAASRATLHDMALKGDQAYDLIRREIVSCRILPGARVTEPELTDRFGLGKASLRIALQRLTQGGLIASIPRHGYRVAPVTAKDVDEIFTLRVALEPLAAREAAGRVNRGQLERLERACRGQMPAEVGNQIDFFMEANRSFHMAIAAASGNERLHRTLSGLMDEMTRLVALGFGVQGVRPNIENDHELLIEHLSAGDADAAERVARRHVETFRDMTMEKVVASLKLADAPLAPSAASEG
ncbi:GntR family transcriptional regulator [Methylopila musalis]|uniref:GntR family transcriptional regulator n=1 Tax=Methylopila musalis TaxID=1134781 RepID=A0ABW3Z939_9HYPH